MIINPILLSIFWNFLFSSFSSLESFWHFLSLSRILPAISIEFFRRFPFISILYTYVCQYITHSYPLTWLYLWVFFVYFLIEKVRQHFRCRLLYNRWISYGAPRQGWSVSATQWYSKNTRIVDFCSKMEWKVRKMHEKVRFSADFYTRIIYEGASFTEIGIEACMMNQ